MTEPTDTAAIEARDAATTDKMLMGFHGVPWKVALMDRRILLAALRASREALEKVTRERDAALNQLLDDNCPANPYIAEAIAILNGNRKAALKEPT